MELMSGVAARLPLNMFFDLKGRCEMKSRIVVLVAVLVVVLVGSSAFANISLGTAANFALLGGSTVANTGSSVINGDVGSAPTPAVSGFPPGVVNGNLYLATNDVTNQAHTDLIAAYNAAKNALGSVAGPADLGGAVLAPGIYSYAAVAPWTAGTLTLDGQLNPNEQWIFQIGTALTTPANATVSLIHGASANNVFWQLGSSLTLGAANTFAGNILAHDDITFGGGTLNGRALAIDGAVTIPVAETVNVPVPEPCTLALLGIGLVGLISKKRRATVV